MMDLQKLITDLLGQLNGNAGLVEKFRKDPMGTVQSLLKELNLSVDDLKKIVDGVSAKLKLDDVASTAQNVMGLVNGLLGKK